MAAKDRTVAMEGDLRRMVVIIFGVIRGLGFSEERETLRSILCRV